MLPATLREILDTFALVSDPADRAALLIDFADQFRQVPPHVAVPPFPKQRRVPACESEAYVWLVPQADGTANLHFAVENPSGVSAKALASILTSTLSGLTPEEIEQVSPDIVEQIFRQNISMGKGMGLMAMVQAVRALARAARQR
ncbi:MAG: SufE family protein [Vicinamibacterales bacterium]|jgi:sulfur transfer protein SufE|nr:SufE family protein [Vicinamibacterales bacterium]